MGLRKLTGFPDTGEKFRLPFLENLPLNPRLLIGRNLEMISVFVSIPIHGRFSRAIEKSQKLKVFGMGYWVVLVRMTPQQTRDKPSKEVPKLSTRSKLFLA